MGSGAFIFDHYGFEPRTGVLSLHYAFEGGPSFEEIITFPKPAASYDAEAADRLFRLLFLLAGVSYYKARVPHDMMCKAFDVDADTAAFVTKVYEQGLGEFAHENGLDLRGHIRFSGHGAVPEPLSLSLGQRVLVPVGGGKDSIVTLEALRDAGFDLTLFALGGEGGAAKPIADTIRVSGLTHLYVSRTLSPALFDLNKAGAYNGHVPITAILSVIALASAALRGFSAVVMSNERSASAPNIGDVNHQYSKSLDFERDLAGWVKRHVSPDLGCFSLLRPLSEIDIARRFARLDAYHGVFRSCNAAFRQDVASRGTHWCGHCPKCRFVFLALAPFVNKQKLLSVFGADLLNDAAQTDGFAELAGLSAHKPFECVGEVEESAAALQTLAGMDAWKEDAVVRQLAPKLSAPALESFFAPSGDHDIPDAFMKAIT